MSQMKLKSIGEPLGSVENARVRFGDFFKFTNGLVFRFEAVIMGQYGILILIMSFILEFCYAGLVSIYPHAPLYVFSQRALALFRRSNYMC